MYPASPREFSNTVSRCRRRVVLHHLRLDLPIVMHSAMSGSSTLLSPFTNSFIFKPWKGCTVCSLKVVAAAALNSLENWTNQLSSGPNGQLDCQ